jgi:translocator protein
MPTPGHSLIGLIGWLLLCFSAAGLGALFPPGEWYDELTKPAWNPPAYVFGPVWTILYAMMAVAAWIVWKNYGFRGALFALSLFLIQLAFNAAWTPIFFGMRMPGLAFANLMLLWTTLLATVIVFFQHSKPAGALLLPYFAWVTFAAALNFSIWQLNV